MSGGYVVFELSGPRVLNILKTGTELDLSTPSGGVMRRFHRQEVFLYRWQAENTFRIHTQCRQLEPLSGLLAEHVTGEQNTQDYLSSNT